MISGFPTPGPPSNMAPHKKKARDTAPGKFAYFNRDHEAGWPSTAGCSSKAQSDRHLLLERVRFLAIELEPRMNSSRSGSRASSQQVDSGPHGVRVGRPGRRSSSSAGIRPGRRLAGRRPGTTAPGHQKLAPAAPRPRGDPLPPAPRPHEGGAQLGVDLFPQPGLPAGPDAARARPVAPLPAARQQDLNVVVALEKPRREAGENGTASHVAILPVPRILPRLVTIAPTKGGPQRTIFLSDIIKLCAGDLFPGYKLKGARLQLVTRNSDLYCSTRRRPRNTPQEDRGRAAQACGAGPPLRLEIEKGVDEGIFSTLCQHLSLSQEYVYQLHGPINLLRLQSLADMDRPDLKFPPFTPVNVSPLHDPSRIFEVVRQQDVLLHHPYDAFTPVVDFVEQAARDPQVIAIKQTLYRTSGDSPIVRALIEASRNDKQVTALVELKARAGFDEANNIQAGPSSFEEGRRARRLRARGAEDAHWRAMPRRKERGAHDAQLRPPGDRQLQSQDRPAVLRPELFHLEEGHHRRRLADLQHPDGHSGGRSASEHLRGRALQPPQADRRADKPRGGELRAGKPARILV